jgi:hypothetical protein
VKEAHSYRFVPIFSTSSPPLMAGLVSLGCLTQIKATAFVPG